MSTECTTALKVRSGQAVTVENKPGGNGFIGVQTALNPPHDGHTVFIGSNSTLTTNAATFRKLPYDPLTDFTPITLLSRGPCLIIVPASSPYHTLKALVEEKAEVLRHWAKAGKIRDVDPYHLIFLIWATTQHYADFAPQIEALTGSGIHDDRFRKGALETLSALLFEGLLPRA